MNLPEQTQENPHTTELPSAIRDSLAAIGNYIIIETIQTDSETTLIHATISPDSNQADIATAFKTIMQKLKPYNLLPVFSKLPSSRTNQAEQIVIKIIPAPEIKPNKLWINFLLLALTFLSTIGAGISLAISFFNPPDKNLFNTTLLTDPRILIYGILFSLALLIILGTHEFGHYFACKQRRISATLPYFIPAPFPPLGTFGAIIRIKSPIYDKNSLISIGAAGPICGFIIAIPIIIIGLKLSKIIPVGQPGQAFIGNSLLFWGLTKLFVPPLSPGYDVMLHPIAFAGWVGGFVTALNLLPISQLDGGHIVYALIGDKNKFVAWVIIGILIVLGLYWQGWLLWAIIAVFIMGLNHPPPLNNISPVDPKHRNIGIIALFIFILTFIPVPFYIR